MTLAGQTAIVTGGTRGIGAAMAQALAGAGAKVAVCHAPGADDPAPAPGVLTRPADISDEHAVEAFFDTVTTELGPPTLVFANAGILTESPLAETSVAEWDRIIGVNLRGAFLTARAAARRMEEGRIVFTASDLGLLGRAEMAAYCASKGGVISLTRALARELAPRILVNAIAPGSVETDMTAGMTPEAQAKDLADTPLGRMGRPEEIAAMALFLAGPEAAFITGQCFGVNGGSAMY